VNIIKFSISVARNITEKKKVDYNMIYDVHKKLDVTIVHYFEIVHVLIETLRECLKILFDSSVETSWKKVMSIILNNIIKIHNHTSVKSSFGLPDFMAPTPSLKSV
jgi:hemoglobin-like flavoprotein